jgi:glutamate-1-semialdehyde aminotransferase
MLDESGFQEMESNVRYYSREYPAIFSRAERSLLFDTRGARYIDFFCGAGVLNYGHNHPSLKRARKVTGRGPIAAFTNALQGSTGKRHEEIQGSSIKNYLELRTHS